MKKKAVSCGTKWGVVHYRRPDILFGVANHGSRFVAVGTDLVLVSDDGLNWTEGTPPRRTNQFAVTYGKGKFVAVGSRNHIATSPDGIKWTERRFIKGTGGLWGVAHGEGTFVAVGDKGQVLTSPDAITWTTRNSPTSARLQAVVYGDGKFIAVGVGGRVYLSTDRGATLGEGIKTAHIQDNAVTGSKLKDDTVSSAKIKEADNTTNQDTSKGYGIKTGHIQNEAITTPKIADISVTESKLGANSVTSAKIKDGNVGTAKLADKAVTNAKLYDGSVNEDKLSTAVKAKLVTNGNNHDHSGGLSSQGGKVRRDFLTWNTTVANSQPIHIKTNIPKKSNVMYRFLVEGYNYGVRAVIFSDAVGYTYREWDSIGYDQTNNYANGASISQYYSSDGYVVIKLTIPDTYYIGFSVSAWFTNPTGTAFGISAVVYHQSGDL